ncbi:hypothetical protein Ciccas_012304 [Cichlidogyrus casuarinus]|uniref:Testicular haploid expressed gene protein-like n=1 Tax=Cichlidogyrus casuarinus TaxID=1844966 RepID=A0ABD2PNV7_9PLAT
MTSNSRISRRLFQQIYRDPVQLKIDCPNAARTHKFQFTWNLDELPQKNRLFPANKDTPSPGPWKLLSSNEIPEAYCRLPKLKAKRRSPQPSSQRATVAKRLALNTKQVNVNGEPVLRTPPAKQLAPESDATPTNSPNANWALELLCQESNRMTVQEPVKVQIIASSPVKRKPRLSEPLPKRRSSLVDSKLTGQSRQSKLQTKYSFPRLTCFSFADYFAVKRNPFASSHIKRVC